MAWLHAVPDVKANGKEVRESRYTKIVSANGDDYVVPMPPLEDEVYILNLLTAMGVVLNTGMGISAISWAEINNYMQVTGIHLSTWEAETVQWLSNKYVAEFNAASEPTRPAPFIDIVEEDISEDELEQRRKDVSSKVANFLRSFKKNKR